MTPTDEKWQIRMFGGLQASRGGQYVAEFPTRKVASLLAYLARRPEEMHRREDLAQEFWPGKDPAQSQNSLSNSLSYLRKQFDDRNEGAVIRSRNGLIGLNPDAIVTDLARLDDGLRSLAEAVSPDQKKNAMKRIMLVYKGDLLPELSLDWVQAERLRLARTVVQALLQLAYECDKEGEWDEAREYAERATRNSINHKQLPAEIADLHIQAHDYLMRLYLQKGQVETAREHWISISQLSQKFEQKVSADALQLSVTLSDDHPWDALSLQLPPPVSVGGRPSVWEKRLPDPRYRFFGREAQIEQAHEWLLGRNHFISKSAPLSNRLVSLWGAGGIGKTRLAQRIAETVASASEALITFISLSGGTHVMRAIGDGLGIECSPYAAVEQVGEFFEQEFLDQLCLALNSAGPRILILDDLEVSSKGFLFLERLLNGLRSSQVVFIVTSKRPLGLADGCAIEVPPLPLPDPAASAETLRSNPCVGLFEAQAKAARPGFAVTRENGRAIARLCRLLRGIPLAIELAAARTSSFSADDILSNLLHDREAWSELVEGQEVLGRTLYWTHRLLSPSLQDFFSRLSVFHSGWTLTAAKEICGQEASEPRALEYLEELCLCRLVEAQPTDASQGHPAQRYYMRDEPLAFARAHPAARQPRLRMRHARYFRHLLLTQRARLNDDPEDGLKERLHQLSDIGLDRALTADTLAAYRAEHANLYAALEWCLDTSDSAPESSDSFPRDRAATGTGLAAYLWGYWNQRNLHREGLRWLDKAMSVAEDSTERAELYNGASILTVNLKRPEDALRLLEQGWMVAERVQEAGCHARLANSYGHVWWYLSRDGDGAPQAERRKRRRQAKNWYQEALNYYSAAGSKAGRLWPLHGIGKILKSSGDERNDRSRYRAAYRCYILAVPYFEESLAVARESGDDQGASLVLESLATLLQSLGDLPQCRDSRDRMRTGLSKRPTVDGTPSPRNPIVEMLLEQCLQIRLTLQDRGSAAAAAEILSEILWAQGRHSLAARLDGAAEGLRASAGMKTGQRVLVHRKARQGEAGYQTWFNEGQERFGKENEHYLARLLKLPLCSGGKSGPLRDGAS